jgi:hypothetical protein
MDGMGWDRFEMEMVGFDFDDMQATRAWSSWVGLGMELDTAPLDVKTMHNGEE